MDDDLSMHSVDNLPQDVWRSVAAQLSPYDLVVASGVCRDLHEVTKTMWDALLTKAAIEAVENIAVPRGLDSLQTAENVAEVRSRACEAAGRGMAGTSERTDFFLAVPHLADAVVAVLAQRAAPERSRRPPLCFISFALRAYDTTDFVERHPGGAQLMQRHHGCDATPVFDAFPHSFRAHHLMRSEMLRFDAIAFVGRFGAPHDARRAVPKKWTLARELHNFFEDLANNVLQGIASEALGRDAAGATTRTAAKKPSFMQLLALAAAVSAALWNMKKGWEVDP